MAADTPKPASLYYAAFLRSLRLRPATVIDVGVRNGTPELYDAFPDAEFILVDPQPGGESLLNARPARYSFHNVGLGAVRATMKLNEERGKSSLLLRTSLTRGNVTGVVDVPIIPMDDLLDEVAPATPLGVKIDTEGFELEVLRGLRRHAEKVEFFICEVSTRHCFVNGYLFSDMILEMKSPGFELHSVLNPPMAKARFYDCLFLRRENQVFGPAS